MLYLTAQPDKNYFIWQLEIQLRNLNNLGIPKNRIQVLVAYNKDLGLNPAIQNFIDENSHLGTFFTYKDKREKPKYKSSVRPNILSQHFKKYPELSKSTIMYHDSDILFSRIPIIENVENDDVCYVSDTRSYLDINYIRSTSNEDLLDEMLDVVGLSKEKLIQENEHSGGAQYILKGVTSAFWEKVELDSENLFIVMNDFNRKLWEREYTAKKVYRSKIRGIQAWCADMWAVLWNLWLENKQVQIHPEMEFSWPYNPIEDWERLSIQHYSGNVKNKSTYFKKNEYLNFFPWYDEALNSIPESNCSFKIVELIKKRKLELDQVRDKCPNVGICLFSDEIVDEYANITKAYIQKHIAIEILQLNNGSLENAVFQDFLINKTKIICIPSTIILSIIDLKSLIVLLQYSAVNRNYSVNQVYKIDALFNESFSKVLDTKVLAMNVGKMNSIKIKKVIYTLHISKENNFNIHQVYDLIHTKKELKHSILDLKKPIFSLI